METERIFFTNLQVLGFDSDAMERRLRIPFKPDMFKLPNKKGFENVMHFLFLKLDSGKCREMMRDCWPVDSKPKEAAFRKVCVTWLTHIERDDPDAHFPRINASVFMSPGGDRIYQLLLCFSRYVLYKLSIKNGMKQSEFLRYPVMKPDASHLSHVVANTIKCGVVRERKKFLDHTQMATAMQDEWRKYASDLVKENRAQAKEIRDLERKVKEEMEKSRSGLGSGSPLSKKSGGMMEYDYNIQKVKRTQKVQKVRENWKALDEFYVNHKEEREIVESVLKGTLEKYKIDAAELNVKVPDLLLRECEHEIQRRGVDNIYQGGKLNLLSVVHLWNLCLHLYIETLHQAGIPKVEELIPDIKSQIHAHHALFVNAQALNTKVDSYLLPDLEKSISSLKAKVTQQLASLLPSTPRPQGLSFMPPTPPVVLAPSASTKTPAEMGQIPSRSRPAGKELTPEAASRLIDSITASVHSHASLPQGSPLFGRSAALRGDLPQQSRLPQPMEKAQGKRGRVHSAPQQSGVKVTGSGTTMESLPTEESYGAKMTMTSQVTRHVRIINDVVSKPPAVRGVSKRPRSDPVQPVVERHTDLVVSLTRSPSGSEQSPVTHRNAQGKGSGNSTGSFEYEADVQTTPLTKGDPEHEDDGPLSSTRIEHGREPIDREQVQRVAQQLFTPDVSDTDEEILTLASPDPQRSRLSHPSPNVQKLSRLESEMFRAASPILGQKDDLPSSISDASSPRSVRSGNHEVSDSPYAGQETRRQHEDPPYVYTQQVHIETVSGAGNAPSDNLLGLGEEEANEIVNTLMSGSTEDPLGLAREFDEEYNVSHVSRGHGDGGQGLEEVLDALHPTDQAYRELKETETPRLPQRSRAQRGAAPKPPKLDGGAILGQTGDGDGADEGQDVAEEEIDYTSESELSEPRYGRSEYANVPSRFSRNKSNNNPRLTTTERNFLAQSLLQSNLSLQANLTLGDTINSSKRQTDDVDTSARRDVTNTSSALVRPVLNLGEITMDDENNIRNPSASQQEPCPLLIDFSPDKSCKPSHHVSDGETDAAGGEMEEVDGGEDLSGDEGIPPGDEEENVRAISFHNGTFTEMLERSPAKIPAVMTHALSPRSIGSRGSNSHVVEVDQGSPRAESLISSVRSQGSCTSRSRSTGSSSQRSDADRGVEDFLSTDVDTLIARYKQLRGQVTSATTQHINTNRSESHCHQSPVAAAPAETNLISLSDTPATSRGRIINPVNTSDPFSPGNPSNQIQSLSALSLRPGQTLPGQSSQSCLPIQVQSRPSTLATGFRISPLATGPGITDVQLIDADGGVYDVTPPGEQEDALMTSFPMSPHTEWLHTSEVDLGKRNTPRRLSGDLWDNILTQNDSLLVPPSPEQGGEYL